MITSPMLHCQCIHPCDFTGYAIHHQIDNGHLYTNQIYIRAITKEVNENVKAANSCLRKAKWQAKELAVFTGEVVRLMDKEGHSLQGFFNRVEFVLVDGTIKFRVVINPILECENCIMASCHEDYLYEVVSVEKFTYKNYRYHL